MVWGKDGRTRMMRFDFVWQAGNCVVPRSSVLALAAIAAVSALAGCASQVKPTPFAERAPSVTRFSSSPVTDATPQDWQPWIISRFNKRTQYRVIEKDGRHVLEARADKSASGILQELSLDPLQTPILRWQWKVTQTLPGADLTKGGRDDSPVRVIVSFDGDFEKLDVEDRAMANMVKIFSGRAMPYATLMYVWDNNLPADVMLDNAHSSRAKMVVVESGAARVGQWLTFTRDITADFQRAFGEKPGRIISVGVMSDSNTTEQNIVSYYGDISLLSRAELAALATHEGTQSVKSATSESVEKVARAQAESAEK
jgi:hypothetical protein